MLLQKKIIKILNKQLNVVAIYNNYITFGYKDDNWSIQQISLFNYEVRLNNNSIFVGNYFQLEGFLKGIKDYYKSNEIVLRDPKALNIQLKELFTVDSSVEKQYVEKIKSLSEANKNIPSLKNEINIWKSKAGSYKDQLQRLMKTGEERNKKLSSQETEIVQLKKDCEEAANLISDLYYKKTDIEYGTKHYKLDHFPKDVQEFILDIIKEYYNK